MVLDITHNQFAGEMDDIYYAILDNPTKGLNTIHLHALIMDILTTYTQISQPDLDGNMTNFHFSISLGLSLAVYTKKREKCQIFAADAGLPVSNKTMITTGTKHTQACGNMTLAWHKWKCPPLPDHTWPN
jgi:hypothetical protein